VSSATHRVTGPEKKDIIGRAMATDGFRAFRRFFAQEQDFQFLRTIVTESTGDEGLIQTVTFILDDGQDDTKVEINITFHNNQFADARAEIDHYKDDEIDFIEFYRFKNGKVISEEIDV